MNKPDLNKQVTTHFNTFLTLYDFGAFTVLVSETHVRLTSLSRCLIVIHIICNLFLV